MNPPTPEPDERDCTDRFRQQLAMLTPDQKKVVKARMSDVRSSPDPRPGQSFVAAEGPYKGVTFDLGLGFVVIAYGPSKRTPPVRFLSMQML